MTDSSKMVPLQMTLVMAMPYFDLKDSVFMKYLNFLLWSEGIQGFIKVERVGGSCEQFSNIR